MYFKDWVSKPAWEMSKEHQDSERLIVYSHPHYAQLECNIPRRIAKDYNSFEDYLTDVMINYEDENSPVAIRAFKERMFLRCMIAHNDSPVIYTMPTHKNGHLHQNYITHSLSSLDFLRDYDNHYFLPTQTNSGTLRRRDQSWLNPETVLVGAGNYIGACLNSTIVDMHCGQKVAFEINFTYANKSPTQQFSQEQRTQFKEAY